MCIRLISWSGRCCSPLRLYWIGSFSCCSVQPSRHLLGLLLMQFNSMRRGLTAAGPTLNSQHVQFHQHANAREHTFEWLDALYLGRGEKWPALLEFPADNDKARCKNGIYFRGSSCVGKITSRDAVLFVHHSEILSRGNWVGGSSGNFMLSWKSFFSTN